jgi:FecR protein
MRSVPLLLVAFVLVAPSAVAQIARIDGDVAAGQTVHPGWTDPHAGNDLAVGRTLRTGAGSRAAIKLDAGVLDLDRQTRLEIVATAPDNLELALPQGRIRLDLQKLDPGQNVGVDLPRGGLWLRQKGEYDIAAGSLQQPSRIAVLSGLAHFSGHDVDTDFEGAAADGFDSWARAQPANPPAPSGYGNSGPERRERSVERRPEHHRYVRRQWHRGYSAYRAPFNPLQPLFQLFRAL